MQARLLFAMSFLLDYDTQRATIQYEQRTHHRALRLAKSWNRPH